MRLSLAFCACLCLCSSVLSAESKNPADYPLRVSIFGRDQTTFYRNGYANESKGDGRANLYANGEVHGVDFSFDCGQKLRVSFGYETYPARWKKPNQEITVLLPIFGKSNSYFTCDLKTAIKDTVYARRANGSMGEEPSAELKAWMAKHNYDPEHGKDMPTGIEPRPAQASQ
jgi:hypothetical protein